MLRLFSALLLLALLTQSSHGLTTVYISPQGSDTTGTGEPGNPYLSLQKAITTAQGAGNLDVTVHCTPGTYYYLNNVNITVTQGTIDISPSESGECDFLLYHSSGEAFFISASGVNTSIVLTNLAITGGTSYSTGGLISATDGATVVAHFVTFANGTAASNGGLVSLVNSAGSKFTNCQFYHGTSTGVASGGGAVSAFNTDVTFLNCNFTGNTAERGGAVLIKNQQDAIVYAQAPTFTACVFIDNSAAPAAPNNAASSVSGGAVQIDTLFGSQSVLIIGSTFDGNKAETASGGAIFIGMGGSATTLSSIFRNHKAHIGGAIYADTSEYVSNRSDYYYNTATHINDNVSGQGGAIAINTGFVTLDTCVFEANTAGTQGGALAHVGGAGHLSNPLPQDQTSITGCTFVENVAINGGAFYAYGLYNLMSIVNTNWIQNRATGEGLQSGGGAIFASTAPVQVSGNSFENNTAEVGMGGAMYIALAVGSTASTDFSPSVVSTHFQFNRAATGGAVCLDGLGDNTNAMGFRNTRFVQNTAVCTSCTSATGVEGYGGALMVYNTTVVVLNVIFYDNFASLKGGAFFSAGEVANTATISASIFYGNQISEDVPTPGGLSVYVGGLTNARFFNANETIDPSQGYQFVVADNAQFTLVDTDDEGLQTSPCVFSGLAARDNAQVYINCSMAVDNLELEDAASINLMTTTNMLINKNIIWRGGGFVCSNLGLESAASNSIIYFRSSSKGTASLTNSRPKYLNSCNFASTGTLLIQNFVGAELTDLEVIGRNTPEIFNYGKMIFVGDVILNNEGTTAANLQSHGELQIESTLSLNGRSPFNFVGLSTKDSEAPYFSIFLQNHNATFGTTGADTSAKSTSIPTYTAFTINGEFHPQGNFQVIVPDFWKGKWNDLIKFTSRSAKFLTKRLLVPNEHQSYDSYKMKVDYNSNSIDCSIKKSQSSMTGGQVFGVIFGVLLAVLLLAGLAYYFYRRHHGPATFEGEVYEPINQPKYGTTN